MMSRQTNTQRSEMKEQLYIWLKYNWISKGIMRGKRRKNLEAFIIIRQIEKFYPVLFTS